MKLCIYLLLVAYTNNAQCIGFNDLFQLFKNPTSESFRSKLIATECTVSKNRRQCQFNRSSFGLNTATSVIELDVNTTSERKIQCNRVLNTNGKQKTWYGTCNGDANDANFITRVDSDGKEAVYGSIHIGDDICRIGPNVYGEEEMHCIPKNDFQPEDLPREIPEGELPGARKLAARNLPFGFVASNETKTLSKLRGRNHLYSQERELFDDSGSTIDIMVVWTKDAECLNAGFNAICNVNSNTESVMRGLIDLAIAETNTAYELSGIFTQLRLVYSYREPDYDEINDYYTMLEHITYPDDGFMDSVHEKRTLFGADIVQLIVAYGAYCGMAWSSHPVKEYMFGLTHYGCATGYYSFGHEIGHNMNLNHDRSSEKTCNEENTFNYGYKNPNAEFRTILSMDCAVRECDNLPQNGCARIQRYSNSNPSYTYNGKRIGDSKHDNARQLNSVRSLVASFFPAMNCVRNDECNDNDNDTVDTCNMENGVCLFTDTNEIDITENAPENEEYGFFMQLLMAILSFFQ